MIKNTFVGIAALLFISSCMEDDLMQVLPVDEDNLIVNDNSYDLNLRLSQKQDTIGILTAHSRGRIARDFTLVLTEEIASPVVNGETLMASSLDLKNSLIAATYNLQGEPYLGAVDLMTLSGDKLKLTSQLIIQNGDVNAAYFDNSKLYFVGAAEGSDSTSFVGSADVVKNSIQTENMLFRRLGGHTATGLIQKDNFVYVTTGNNESTGGGLHVLNETDLSTSSYFPLRDARWVDIADENVFVQQAMPGNLWVKQLKNNFSSNEISFDGLNTPHAKSTFEISGDLIFVAAGYSGVQIINLKSGTIVGEVPLPSGPTSDDKVCNAVSVDGDLIFISNGEHIAVATFDKKDPINPNPEILGTLDLGNHQSVNHIRYRSNRLLIAGGLGGIKVIRVYR
ncbi:hypothetical protein SAMN04488029_2642 [Reichenbachiella faecimaris]|uniref:LVIVD repeat-containing protein n=2 Tax=Reichenbachiella faecimaris TaxID=692418 RepID=A0A1W2GH44_REIFA|nr:hypothetical protein SAMN04488029_2642 [Reichenbachiella faecimaris]